MHETGTEFREGKLASPLPSRISSLFALEVRRKWGEKNFRSICSGLYAKRGCRSRNFKVMVQEIVFTGSDPLWRFMLQR